MPLDGVRLQRVFVADDTTDASVTVYGLDATNANQLHRLTVHFTGANAGRADFEETITFANNITDGVIINNSINQGTVGETHLHLSFDNSGTANRYDLVADPSLGTATQFNFQTNGGVTSILDFKIVEVSDTETLGYVRSGTVAGGGTQHQIFNMTQNVGGTVNQGVLADQTQTFAPRLLTSSVTDTNLGNATEIVADETTKEAYIINTNNVENVTGSNFLDLIFAADSQAGLIRRIDIGNKSLNPVMESNLDITGMGTATSISLDNPDPNNAAAGIPFRHEHFLYAADGTDLRRLDVSNPLADETAPTVITPTNMAGITDVFVYRDEAFIAAGPTVGFVGSILTGTGASTTAPVAAVLGTALAGNVTDMFHDLGTTASPTNDLYVADGSTIVKRYDMSAGTLGALTTINLAGLGIAGVQDVAASHPDASTTLLYVTDSTNDKVGVFNISTPAAPTITTLTTISNSGDIFVTEDAAGQPVVFSAFGQDLTKFGDTGTANAFMSLFTLAEDKGVAGEDLTGILNGTPFTRNANDLTDLALV